MKNNWDIETRKKLNTFSFDRSYFFRDLFLTFTYFRFDLSPPPAPKEKLPPALAVKFALPEAWNGDGFCGVGTFGWPPNWKGFAASWGGADEPNTNPDDGGGVRGCCPKLGIEGGATAWTVSSAMLSSIFAWSLLAGGVEPKANPWLELPKAGCDCAGVAAEVNEKIEAVDGPVDDDPKTEGALLEAAEEDERPKENPAVGVELNPVENEGVEDDCQLKGLELVPALELTALFADELEEASPKVAPEVNKLDAGAEEPNRELPEDKPVFPAKPNDVDDELNDKTGVLWVEDATPLLADKAGAPNAGIFPGAKVEFSGRLLESEVVDAAPNWKTLLPMLDTLAADVSLGGMPKVVSCLVLVSTDPTPPGADSAGAEVEETLELPNLKIDEAGKDGIGEDVERLVEVTGWLLLVAAAGEGLMDEFWFVILLEKVVAGVEKIDGVEPRDPLLRFESGLGELKENKLGVGVAETDDTNKFSGVPTVTPALELLSPALSEVDSFGTPNDRMLQIWQNISY